MPQPPVDDDTLRERARLVEEHGNSENASRVSGIPSSTLRRAHLQARRRGLIGESTILAGAGYDLSRDEMTPEEAWSAGHTEFERLIGDHLRKRWKAIPRPAGPGVVWHVTDTHLDDPGCAIRLLSADLQAARDMNALVAFGGDLLNNWPLAGRLAAKWAQQECTAPEALLRAQYFLENARPAMCAWGNHDEWNSYLTDLFRQWLPKDCLADQWSVAARLQPQGGREIRVILSHKFQKGSSWFHKMHGHIREMLEGEEADLLMDGHLHCDGVMEHSLPERNHAALGVASGGYKVLDKFAQRISRGAKIKLRGRCHWIVYDPSADVDESLCLAFKSARQAEAYLGGLQNLRAV